jgi:hypothetical protein
VFVVNSLSTPSLDWDQERGTLGTVDVLLQATGVPIDHYLYEAVELLRDTAAGWKMLGSMAGPSSRAVGELIIDVALMAAANILIFSIWYWIIDPPPVIEDEPDPRPWAFLFPQRGSHLPGYESWNPVYADYLSVAFTTSFAFSPTDAAPLNRTAKLLMLLQSTISVVTLTGIAGGAINVLGGAG